MAKTKKTRQPRQPRPIPAMLEGAFSTQLENTIAEMNNTLARESRLTNDPAFVMLTTIRRELIKENVCTFQRSGTTEAAAPAAAPKTPKAKAKSKKTTTAAAPAPTPDLPPVREIEESELEALAVDGTVSDEAPYGKDSKGVALAPYGVKLSGIPKKRRGRKAPDTPAVEPEADTPEAEASDDSEDEEEGTEGVEVEETDDDDDDDDDDLEDDDLDDLLADL